MEFGFGSVYLLKSRNSTLTDMENKVTIDYRKLSMCYYVKDHIRISNQARCLLRFTTELLKFLNFFQEVTIFPARKDEGRIPFFINTAFCILLMFRKSVSSAVKYIVYVCISVHASGRQSPCLIRISLVFDSPERLRTSNLASVETVGCSGWIWAKEWLMRWKALAGLKGDLGIQVSLRVGVIWIIWR